MDSSIFDRITQNQASSNLGSGFANYGDTKYLGAEASKFAKDQFKNTKQIAMDQLNGLVDQQAIEIGAIGLHMGYRAYKGVQANRRAQLEAATEVSDQGRRFGNPAEDAAAKTRELFRNNTNPVTEVTKPAAVDKTPGIEQALGPIADDDIDDLFKDPNEAVQEGARLSARASGRFRAFQATERGIQSAQVPQTVDERMSELLQQGRDRYQSQQGPDTAPDQPAPPADVVDSRMNELLAQGKTIVNPDAAPAAPAISADNVNERAASAIARAEALGGEDIFSGSSAYASSSELETKPIMATTGSQVNVDMLGHRGGLGKGSGKGWWSVRQNEDAPFTGGSNTSIASRFQQSRPDDIEGMAAPEQDFIGQGGPSRGGQYSRFTATINTSAGGSANIEPGPIRLTDSEAPSIDPKFSRPAAGAQTTQSFAADNVNPNMGQELKTLGATERGLPLDDSSNLQPAASGPSAVSDNIDSSKFTRDAVNRGVVIPNPPSRPDAVGRGAGAYVNPAFEAPAPTPEAAAPAEPTPEPTRLAPGPMTSKFEPPPGTMDKEISPAPATLNKDLPISPEEDELTGGGGGRLGAFGAGALALGAAGIALGGGSTDQKLEEGGILAGTLAAGALASRYAGNLGGGAVGIAGSLIGGGPIKQKLEGAGEQAGVLAATEGAESVIPGAGEVLMAATALGGFIYDLVEKHNESNQSAPKAAAPPPPPTVAFNSAPALDSSSYRGFVGGIQQ